MIQADPNGEFDQYGAPKAKPPAAAPPVAPPASPAAPKQYTPNDYVGMTNRQWTAGGYDPSQGGAVADKAGYNWYHTGALGGSSAFGGADWIQGKADVFGSGAAPVGQAPSPGGPPSPQTITQTLQGPVTAGNQIQEGAPTTVASAFQQALTNRLTNQPAVNAQSPEIAGAIAANRASEQRSFEQNRAQMAERAASQGLDQNAFNSQLMGASQERAGRESQFAGGAVLDLARQRSQEITAALALGGAMLSDIERTNLQKELAQLQATISREATQGQLALGGQDLDVRRSLGEGQLNLGLLNALLGDRQFNSNLGLQAGMFGANLNQRSLTDIINSL